MDNDVETRGGIEASGRSLLIIDDDEGILELLTTVD